MLTNLTVNAELLQTAIDLLKMLTTDEITMLVTIQYQNYLTANQL